MAYELWIAGIMLASLVIYTLTGGADFGGGVWDLLASGPRADKQRQTIAKAIGPIWEANHVWLIVVIVMLFAIFSRAFSVISTALHIPLTLMLIGIVLRGSAFVFRSYDPASTGFDRRWSLTFAIASTATPLMLGIVVGAVCSDAIQIDRGTGTVVTNFYSEWLAPFPIAVGLFTLALFAYLGAVYLTLESDDTDLQDDFRIRALLSAVLVGALALVCYLLAGRAAPRIQHGLSSSWWAIPLHLSTGAAAITVIVALRKRSYQLARILAIVQVTLIIGGWGLAQYPYLVAPQITIQNAAAPSSVLKPVFIALVLGSLLITPAFVYLYTVFKKRAAS